MEQCRSCSLSEMQVHAVGVWHWHVPGAAQIADRQVCRRCVHYRSAQLVPLPCCAHHALASGCLECPEDILDRVKALTR